jgi:hypothetical protein
MRKELDAAMRNDLCHYGMILAYQVLSRLDSKYSLWYTVVQHNVNVPDTAHAIGLCAVQIDKQ